MKYFTVKFMDLTLQPTMKGKLSVFSVEDFLVCV